jgi:tetratricopeptide (TPR) repeat protein
MKRIWVGLLIAAAVASFPGSGQADVCKPCTEQPKDPKVPGRSLKSYWQVAHQGQIPDTTVLAKAFDQGHLALCGAPDNWEWNMFMGMVSAELGRAELAGCYFTQAHKHVTDPKDREKVENNSGHYWVEHYNQALTFLKDDANEQAIEHSKLAIAIAPDSCKAYAIQGAALINLSRHVDAIGALEKGKALCPEDESYKENLFISLHNRGNELFNQGQSASKDSSRMLFAESAKWYERAAELKPDYPRNNFQLAMAYVQMVSLGDSTRVDTARQHLERFLPGAEDKSDRLVALYHLALMEIEAENWAKAAEYADQYIATDPQDTDGYRLKANISVREAKPDAEGFIIFSKGKPVENVDAWLKTSKAGSDIDRLVKEKGKPEAVWTANDSKGNSMDSVFYWSKGEGHAFYMGRKRGSVTFPAQVPGSEARTGEAPADEAPTGETPAGERQ